jgi:hypothetical protein
MQVDVSESGQGSCYAVQFILKSRAFLLELTDYRLHQCLWHRAISSPAFGRERVVRPRTLILVGGSILGARLMGVIHLRGLYALRGKCYPAGGRRALAQARRRRHPSQAIFSEHAPQHIWQKRFYDFNVWTERKRIEKLRYMHRNPVKRSLVASPELWRWSSFRAYFLGETGPVRLNEWEVLKMKTPHSGRVRAESQTAGCPASHFSKSARRGAPPTLYFAVKVAHPPPGQEPNEPV